MLLPEGFRSRVLATSFEPVPGTTCPWHQFPDGGAVFEQRGTAGRGITFEVVGPFRTEREEQPARGRLSVPASARAIERAGRKER